MATPAVLAQQQFETDDVDEIIVVAHKNQRSIRDIAANVTVISRDDIDQFISTSIADVLRYTPGIDYESSGTRFGSEGINIRGISGNRVAILVDGVPLSDQFDVGSFSNATRDFVNAGLIKRIEVLHGPASALYGSSAIGGVVAARTPDPADLAGTNPYGGDLQFTWRDADSSLHGTGLAALQSGGFGAVAGISLRNGNELQSAAADEAFDFRDYQRRSAMLKAVFDTEAGNTWRVTYLHQDAAVSSNLNSMLGSGRFRSTTALEGDDNYRMGLLSLEYEFGEPGGWIDSGVLRAYHQQALVEQTTLDERGLARTPVSIDRYFEFEQDINGVELNLQKIIDGNRATHYLGFGVEYRERESIEYRDGLSTSLVDGSTTNELLGEVFPLRDFPISHSTELGAYIEDSIEISDWTIVAAVRADRYELSPQVDAMYAEDYPFAEPVSLSESDISPKLGLIYRIGDGIDLYAQYAHGFRAPPYEDANIGLEIPFFNYRAIPNPDLTSESSDGVDVGMRWQGVQSEFRFAAFHTRYENFIESKVQIGTDPVSGRVLFQSQNLRDARIQGIEASGSHRFNGALEDFAIDGSFYVARGENGESGEDLNSVGPPQGVIGAAWYGSDGERQLRLQTTMTRGWTHRDETGGELFKPPGYTIFDLFYTQHFGERVTARVGLLNLTDKTYWVWSDVRGLAPDEPVLPYLARPGRSVSLSLNMVW